jgi:hypothetical protein
MSQVSERYASAYRLGTHVRLKNVGALTLVFAIAISKTLENFDNINTNKLITIHYTIYNQLTIQNNHSIAPKRTVSN